MSCFLSNSSLGKKLVMSVTGVPRALHPLPHVDEHHGDHLAGSVQHDLRTAGSQLVRAGRNAVLAAGVVVHFIYAVILTLEQPQGARFAALRRDGAGAGRALGFENMPVLGFIILGSP